MGRYTIILLLILSLFTLHCSREYSGNELQPAVAESTGDAHSHEHGALEGPRPEKLELPEHLSTVLRKEMAGLTGGMGILFSHLVQGNGTEAAEMAERIHNSFILKQELSEAELKQLISLLPEAFIKMDRTFHANAAKVAEAAQQKDFATAIHLYGEMAYACVECHTQFAAKRFPGLAKIEGNR